MAKELTKQEVWVRKELEKLYPQLIINSKKTCGAAYEQYGHDLLSYCIEIFLNKPIGVQVDAFKKGKAENFITFVMGMQLKSKTSPFWKEYKKFNLAQREFFPNYDYKANQNSYFPQPFEEEENDCVDCLKKFLQKQDPYSKMLIEELIIRERSYADVERQYNINYSSLRRDLELLKVKLKAKCRHLL